MSGNGIHRPRVAAGRIAAGAGDAMRRQSFLNTPSGFALCVFLAVAGVFLWLEHRAHVLGSLPLLLALLICIGMHFFMHRGHGGHGGQRGGRDEQ